MVALIQALILTSACKPDMVAKNKTGTATSTSTGTSVTMDAASFAVTPTQAYGWTDASSAALSFAITASTVPGAKYECRSGPKALFTGGSPPSWVWCDGAAGTSAVHYPVINVGTPSGTYRSEVRYTLAGSTGTSATMDYYVHTSLNGVTACAIEGNDTAADTAARAALGAITGTFGMSSTFSNPFISVAFDASARKYPPHSWYTANTDNAAMLSLRRTFKLSSDRKTLIVRRVYQARLGNGHSCQNRWAGMGAIHNSPHCSAFVVSADGRAACLAWVAGAYVSRYVSKWAYAELDEMQLVIHNKTQGMRSSKKTRVPASATGKTLYIPD